MWDKFSSNASILNISTSKINCAENKCENIPGYPTVVLHKKDGHNIMFEGSRTIKNLEEFVKSNV